jgi:RNA-directed DNA polymerase
LKSAGFDLRRVRRIKADGHYILLTPKKKARQAIKAKIRDLIEHGRATPIKMLVANINAALKGWVTYFRVGHASRAFNEVREYLEMKLRTLLSRRKRRRKTGVGWQRWSSTYLYETLGLYWDWKTHPLPSALSFA